MTTQSFSLAAGGPLHRLWRWARLSDDGLNFVPRRIAACIVVAWLPLLILSGMHAAAWGGSLSMPFLRDYDVGVRFLVVVPLLIAAETLAERRLSSLVQQFGQLGVISAEMEPRYAAAHASAVRLRDSKAAEMALLAIVYVVGVFYLWRQHMVLAVTGWLGSSEAGHLVLSPAGLWFAWVSLPLFQFLLLRWYWRLLVWARFLWQVSRIDLALVPTHPDHCAGLGFLSQSCSAFMPVAAAHGALLAGHLGNRIAYSASHLTQFRVEILALILFAILIVAGPLCAFASVLMRAKRRALREYGAFAQRYVHDFDRKWLRGGAPASEVPMGSADIQSLADLSNSYETIKSMKSVPIWRDNLVAIAAATALPVLPLTLTMFSFSELVEKLVGILL